MSSVQIRPPRLISPSRKDEPCAWAFSSVRVICARHRAREPEHSRHSVARISPRAASSLQRASPSPCAPSLARSPRRRWRPSVVKSRPPRLKSVILARHRAREPEHSRHSVARISPRAASSLQRASPSPCAPSLARSPRRRWRPSVVKSRPPRLKSVILARPRARKPERLRHSAALISPRSCAQVRALARRRSRAARAVGEHV